MIDLTWDPVSERFYETGVEKGVLYILDNEGLYSTGIPWNGLTNITESPSGGEANPQYANNQKYLNLLSLEEFKGTLEALTYPDEFSPFDGWGRPIVGLKVGQQNRPPFGLCYKTLIGNDSVGNKYGYKIHLIYNVYASPSERAYGSINDSPEPLLFNWELTTLPLIVDGFKPFSSITIDSTIVDAELLSSLEEILYGTDEDTPRLPSPLEIISLLSEPEPEPTVNEWIETFLGDSPGDAGLFQWLRSRYGTITPDPGALAQNGGQARIIYNADPLEGPEYGYYSYRNCTNGQDGTDKMSSTQDAQFLDPEFDTMYWFGWDFGETLTMDLTKYSLRCATPNLSPRNWELEWSDDGVAWTSFDSRVDDETMPDDDTSWYLFSSEGSSGSHRYFRFRVTGVCADGDYGWIFAVSGIEFYGTATVVLPPVTGIDLRYSPEEGRGGVLSYLGRLRDTEAYLHADSGCSPAINGTVGRGLIETSHGGYAINDNVYNSHLVENEWETLTQYMDIVYVADGPIDGYFGIDLGPRRSLIPTHYKFGNMDEYNLSVSRNWTFDGSNDGVTWDVLDDQTVNNFPFAQNYDGYYDGKNYQIFSVPTQETAYRYFRIKPPSPYGDAICAFDVWGDFIEELPVLQDGAIRYEQQGAINLFDGICDSHPPELSSSDLVIDGKTLSLLLDQDLSDSVALDDNEDNHFTLDWNLSSVRPEMIVIGSEVNYEAYLSEFNVEGSNDGGDTWDVLREVDPNVTQNYAWRTPGNLLSVHVSSDTFYSMIRIHQTGFSNNGFDSNENYIVGLSEIEVYGDFLPAEGD